MTKGVVQSSPCAVAAEADYIVSGDKDLLVLGNFRNIPIITAAEFQGKMS